MTALQIGDKAPLFEGIDQDGQTVRLTDFLGKKKVVLYFYPKDDTPGCTAQACDLRDNYQSFLAQGYEIFGISSDSEASHRKFRAKFDLPFPLLADTSKQIHELYGTWGEKSMYGKKYMGTMRYTFVINEEGNISSIITKVDTKAHTKQLLG
jgi:peroxiredoxin Q/BCP